MTEPVRTIGGDPVIPGVDLAGLALRTLPLGASVGAALQCLVLWGTRMMTASAPPSDTPEVGATFYFLFFGTMAAMGAGALTAWRFLGPVGAPWRRAGLAAIAGFATLVAAAAAVPVDAIFGPMALLVPALFFAGLALWSGRRVFAWYRALP
jgi:hypothetical protein